MSTMPRCLEFETNPGYWKGKKFCLTILEMASLRFILKYFGFQLIKDHNDFLLTFVFKDLYFVKLE